MAIHKRSKSSHVDITPGAVDEFIAGGAGNAAKPPKTAVSLRFDSGLLKRIDATAARRGMSRNALVCYWCSRGLEQE